MATGGEESSGGAKEPFKLPLREEEEQGRPRAGPLREGEELAFARWIIPTHATLVYEMLQRVAQNQIDPSILPGDTEWLKDCIELMKKGEITLKSIILQVAKLYEKKYCMQVDYFEDYDPTKDSPYPMPPEDSLFFAPYDDEEEEEDWEDPDDEWEDRDDEWD